MNYNKVSNPLTVISIFAGIAEISGTVVLPFIAEQNQSTYIWFLMIFPIILVILFFLTLNFNHKKLYAPSDYQNDSSFLDAAVKNNTLDNTDKEISGINFEINSGKVND